jgi:hypothetical protein
MRAPRFVSTVSESTNLEKTDLGGIPGCSLNSAVSRSGPVLGEPLAASAGLIPRIDSICGSGKELSQFHEGCGREEVEVAHACPGHRLLLAPDPEARQDARSSHPGRIIDKAAA